MPEITTLTGAVFPVLASKIDTVALVSLDDLHPETKVTAVYGILKAPLLTALPPKALLDGFGITKDFAALTQPGGDPIWIRADAVATFYPPATGDSPQARCALSLGSDMRFVREDPAAVRAALVACGAKF